METNSRKNVQKIQNLDKTGIQCYDGHCPRYDRFSKIMKNLLKLKRYWYFSTWSLISFFSHLKIIHLIKLLIIWQLLILIIKSGFPNISKLGVIHQKTDNEENLSKLIRNELTPKKNGDWQQVYLITTESALVFF